MFVACVFVFVYVRGSESEREREREFWSFGPFIALCLLQFGFQTPRAACDFEAVVLPWMHVTCCPPQLSGALERAVLGVKPLHHSPGERKKEREREAQSNVT